MTYTTNKALPTTRKVELINKKEFAEAVLDKDVKAFLVNINFLNLRLMTIHLAREA